MAKKNSLKILKEYMDYLKILNRVIKDAKVKYERDSIKRAFHSKT